MPRVRWSLLALLLLVAVALLPGNVVSVPLFQLMNSNSSMITQFAGLIHSTGLSADMNSDGPCSDFKCFIVFAPSDAAISAAYPAGLSALSSGDKIAIAKHHYQSLFGNGAPTGTKGLLSAWSSAGILAGTDIGFGQVQILKTESTTLYWLAKQTGSTWSYKVNNAAINVAASNQNADNGVFHVLDQVALPVGSQVALSSFLAAPDAPIATQLSISKSLQIFSDWMSRDTATTSLYNSLKAGPSIKVRTMFLPSDAAWARIPDAVFQPLTNSIEDYRKVLLAHFAPSVCVFTGWMTPSSKISFKTGHSSATQYDASMYLDSSQKAFVSVGGVVAQFVANSVNYPIGDAVIHVVDRVLAFAYETLETLTQANAPTFYAKCSTVPSCQALLTSNGPRTLFAPSDVTSLNSLNATQLEQILLLHFIPTGVGKPDMDVTDLYAAQNNVGQIRFRMVQNNTRYFVEGRLTGRGFVRAELLMYDQPAKNGIFHKIASPLGKPIQTVQDFINGYQDLSSVSAYMGSSAFDPNLGTAGNPFTAFPPNNDAMQKFAAYKGSTGASVGQTILNSVSLRNRVFRRMVLPNQMIVADVPLSGFTDYPTANTAENEKVTLNLKGSPGLTTRTADLTGVNVMANVSMAVGEYECTNGMVYPVNVVLFRDSDIEGYTRSAGTVASSLAVAVLTVLLACLAHL